MNLISISQPKNVTESDHDHATRDENDKNKISLDPDAECKKDVEGGKEYSPAMEK